MTNGTISNGWVELKKIHGEPVQIGEAHRNQWLFPDGYELLGDSVRPGGGHTIIQPPTDKIGKLRTKKRYLEAKLEQAEKAFIAARNDYLTQANAHMLSPAFAPSVPEEVIGQLEAGRDRILKLREEIAKIELKLPDTRRREEQEEMVRQRVDRATKLRNAIGAIEI